MATPNQPTGMATNQPTGMKSVTLEQLTRLEAKLVVGASNNSGLQATTQSKIDRDVKKMQKTLDKVDRDHSGPSSRKRTKDSDTMKDDVSKRIDDGIPPVDAGRFPKP